MQTAVSNVGETRMQSVELAADKNNVVVTGLQVFGSVTYDDSRILSDPGWNGRHDRSPLFAVRKLARNKKPNGCNRLQNVLK